MKLSEPCQECGKTTACYGCIMDLYKDIDTHDIHHDTYGTRQEPQDEPTPQESRMEQ